MNINEVKELIKLIDSTSLDYVKLENDSLKLEVSRNSNTVEKTQNNVIREDKKESACKEITVEKEEIRDNNEIKTENDDNLYIISAPLMGTFYGSPNPDSENFVKIGDVIEEGQTLCILEAMKLMNEINSEVNGEIVEILVKKEELVEYNQPLFKIKPM